MGAASRSDWREGAVGGGTFRRQYTRHWEPSLFWIGGTRKTGFRQRADVCGLLERRSAGESSGGRADGGGHANACSPFEPIIATTRRNQ